MVVKLTEGKYAGLSRDIKPKAAKVGSSFYEYDTEELYDKTLNVVENNGWKKRVSVLEGDSEVSDTIKNKITTKILDSTPFIVIMAGSDDVNFELNDIYIGEISPGRIQIGKVITVPVTSLAQLSSAIDGEIN